MGSVPLKISLFYVPGDTHTHTQKNVLDNATWTHLTVQTWLILGFGEHCLLTALIDAR